MCCSHSVRVLVVLMLIQFVSTTSAQAQVRHTIIAASGEAAPAGGTYGTFLNTIALNARGQIAFDVRLSGPSTSGVFVRNGTTTSTIALGGSPAPGNFIFVSAPSLTTSGDVTFNGVTGIFRGNGTTNVPIVQDGDPAPGGGSLVGGAGFNSNSRGLITFKTFIDGGSATEGVFRNDGPHTAAIALNGTPSPTGGTFLFFSSPVIDEVGRVAFYAGMIEGSADYGIYRSDGEKISTIFAANQTAPGGRIFTDFSDPIVNKLGDVLVLGQFDDGSGLFLRDERDAVAIAVSGDRAPNGETYSSFFGRLTLNDRGQTAFGARLTGGMSGIFRGDRTTVTPIALKGTTAAGTTGTFDTFGDLQIGKDGSVVFIATLTIGVGGVDASNNVGIWIGTSEADLHLVARTGQNIGGKTLTRPVSLAQLDMDQHSIVWLGRFAGNATAIVSSDLASNHQDSLKTETLFEKNVREPVALTAERSIILSAKLKKEIDHAPQDRFSTASIKPNPPITCKDDLLNSSSPARIPSAKNDR